MQADAIIRVRLKKAAEGGRQGPIVIGRVPYACALVLDGEAFDCRVLVVDRTLQLGEAYELPVKFLNPVLVGPRLVPGKSLTLWEGKDIATGEVARVF
jgi:hypothetical protein